MTPTSPAAAPPVASKADRARMATTAPRPSKLYVVIPLSCQKPSDAAMHRPLCASKVAAAELPRLGPETMR